MPIYVYTENSNGIYKKNAFEAVSYARVIADQKSDEVIAISINATHPDDALYQYGANKIIHITNEALKNFDAKAYATALSQVFDGGILVFPQTTETSAFAPMLSVMSGAAYVSNAVAAPSSLSPFHVKRKSFSGKAFMHAEVTSDKIMVGVSQNAYGVKENPVPGSKEMKEVNVTNTVSVINVEKSSGKLDLKEADIVVSAGRGMKSPDNWGMIEDLAEVLGAATACSKPVSDIGWRPHSEHVGQTGKAIAPNLYIAVGISGAIQHLAGINSSKTIVVINNDAEAPFFKSADYGIVGDALLIVPQLVEKLKAFKA